MIYTYYTYLDFPRYKNLSKQRRYNPKSFVFPSITLRIDTVWSRILPRRTNITCVREAWPRSVSIESKKILSKTAVAEKLNRDTGAAKSRRTRYFAARVDRNDNAFSCTDCRRSVRSNVV